MRTLTDFFLNGDQTDMNVTSPPAPMGNPLAPQRIHRKMSKRFSANRRGHGLAAGCKTLIETPMKKKLAPESNFRALRASLPFSLAVVVTLCAFGAAASGAKEAGQNQNPGAPDVFEAQAGEHIAQPESAASGLAGSFVEPQTVWDEIARRRVVCATNGPAFQRPRHNHN